MAHFAQLDDNNIVTNVIVVPDDREADGEAFCHSLGFTGRWIQTSYNTRANTHLLGGTPLRGNYAGNGFIYDEENDLFFEPKPHASWVKNLETASWEPPIPRPADEGNYYWDEESLSWKLFEI